MPDPFDHALAILLIAVIPPRAWLTFRALRRATPEQRPRQRRRLYLTAVITQWGVAAALMVHWALARRPWGSLGLSPALSPGAFGVAIGVAIGVVLVVRRLRGAAPRSEPLERARARLAHVEPLMPHDVRELMQFQTVAVTAGICEELLFRGFLIWYVANFTGLVQAALISSACFGLGPAYQGPRYVVVTGLVGAFFAAVYAISGSIVLPMLIHVLMDLYSGWVGFRVFSGDDGGSPGGHGVPGGISAVVAG